MTTVEIPFHLYQGVELMAKHMGRDIDWLLVRLIEKGIDEWHTDRRKGTLATNW